MKLQYYRLDLVIHAAANDFIVIDGNALLYNLLTNEEHLDWTTHGGQFLHLTWTLEKFIKNLRERQVNFDVVFNACSQLYFIGLEDKFDASSIQLARTMMEKHLRVLQVNCVILDAWYSNMGRDEWDDYLAIKTPTLVIGSTKPKMGNYFLKFSFLLNRLAHATDIDFPGNSMRGFLVHSGFFKMISDDDRGAHVAKLLNKALNLSQDYPNRDAVVNDSDGDDDDNGNGDNGEEKKSTAEKAKEQHVQLMLKSVSKVLSATGARLSRSKVQLGQLAIFTVLLQHYLPLDKRVQTIQFTSPTILEFIHELYGAMVELGVGNLSPDVLIDLFDGRLMHSVCYAFNEKGDKSQLLISFPALEPYHKVVWQSVSDMVQPYQEVLNDMALFWGQPQLFRNHAGTAARTWPESKVFPLQNDFTNEYFGEQWQQEHFSTYDSSDEVVRASAVRGRNFEEKHHWHNNRLLSETTSFIPRTRVDIERMNQSKARLEAYSQSLSKSNIVERKSVVVNKKKSLVQDKIVDLNASTEAQKLNLFKGALQKELKAYENKKRTSSPEVNSDLDSLTKHIKDVYRRMYSLLMQEYKVMNYESELKKAENLIQEYKETDAAANSVELAAQEKLAKELRVHLRSQDQVLSSMSKQMATLNICRKICEERILLLLLDLCDVGKKEWDDRENAKKSEEELRWNVFESVNLCVEYYGIIQTESHARQVSLRSQKLNLGSVLLPIDDSYRKRFQKCADYLSELGFYSYARKIFKSIAGVKVKKGTTPQIEKISIYQLKYNENCRSCTPFLPPIEMVMLHNDIDRAERTFNLGFQPDDWQQELMDYIDEGKSVVVSAPTSSGKTFIAFYLIEKVLRESDDGVIVFICPTKALVNQLYAEIHSRFSKEKREIVGMFTAENKINVTSCQVLVAVPQTMEILLLTAEHYEWKKKLRAVVLDEIHCISESDGGTVWEHILLMIECQFVALSATIGNLNEFTSWLNKSKGNVVPVEYKERPRPLEFYQFDESNQKILSVHPCSTLNPHNITLSSVRNMPMFSPAHCLQLYEVAKKVERRLGINILEGLNPKELTSSHLLYTRDDFNRYGRQLKDRVVAIVEGQNSQQISALTAAIQYLSKEQKDINLNEEYLVQNIVSLVQLLKDKNMFPCISFSFDRPLCHSLACTVADHLENKGLSLWDDPIQEARSRQEIDNVCSKLTDVDEVLIRNLKRGIACHYSSLPDDYQKDVERLFRMKCIPIIFSSSTLALGLNMPCKTVVLAGSNIYMNTIMFNQCAGRAGRRGFDNKGQVIIYGIQRTTFHRLMTSEIPNLVGSMGLSYTFILRLLTMFNEANQKISAKEKSVLIQQLITIFDQPLFALGKNTWTSHQMKYNIRFILEFLRREGYIDESAQCFGFTGMVNHLFFHEPANFILVNFIQNEAFHSMLEEGERSQWTKEEMTEAVLLVMCHLFARREIRKESMSTLPPLPPRFLEITRQFDENLQHIYSQYLHSYFSQSYNKLKDHYLPLSGKSFEKSEDEIEGWDISNTNGDIFVQHVESNSPSLSTTGFCSTFAAMSGNTADFNTFDQLEQNISTEIIFNQSMLPKINFDCLLSSFVLDFYRTGDMDPSIHAVFSFNEGRKLIDDFQRCVSKVCSSLELMDTPRRDILLQTLRRLKRELRARLRGFESYEKMIGLNDKSQRFPVVKVNSKGKRTNAEIVLAEHGEQEQPLIIVLEDGERKEKRILNPKHVYVGESHKKKDDGPSCYVTYPPKIVTTHVKKNQRNRQQIPPPEPYIIMKLKAVEYKYELEPQSAMDRFASAINAHIKRFRPNFKPEREKKVWVQDKSAPEDE